MVLVRELDALWIASRFRTDSGMWVRLLSPNMRVTVIVNAASLAYLVTEYFAYGISGIGHEAGGIMAVGARLDGPIFARECRLQC